MFSAKHVQTSNTISSITNKKNNDEKVGLVTSPYLKVMTLTIGLSAIVGALVDYQMKIIISDNLTETEMASLFGTLYGFIGVISILPCSGFSQSLIIEKSEIKGFASGTIISSWRTQPSGCVIVEV